jgi:hypothetical protein
MCLSGFFTKYYAGEHKPKNDGKEKNVIERISHGSGFDMI